MSTSTIKPKGHYRTSDLYYAAYLKVAEVKFVGTTREDRRVFFLFEDQDGLSELHMQYFNNVSKVPARAYAEEIKAMKAMVHHDG
jgi:hypothetical protein